MKLCYVQTDFVYESAKCSLEKQNIKSRYYFYDYYHYMVIIRIPLT